MKLTTQQRLRARLAIELLTPVVEELDRIERGFQNSGLDVRELGEGKFHIHEFIAKLKVKLDAQAE